MTNWLLITAYGVCVAFVLQGGWIAIDWWKAYCDDADVSQEQRELVIATIAVLCIMIAIQIVFKFPGIYA